MSFVQFNFLLLSPLGHHYPLNKHRKLFSSLDLFHTLYFYLNDKTGQGIQNQDFVSHSLLCPTVLQQILSSGYLIKWDRNASWQTSKATCEWLECIRSQNGVKMFLNSKEMVWKVCSQNCFVRRKDVRIRIRYPESRRKLFGGLFFLWILSLLCLIFLRTLNPTLYLLRKLF